MRLTLKISLLLAAVMAVVLLAFEFIVLNRESRLLEEDVRRDASLVAQTLALSAASAPPTAAEAHRAELDRLSAHVEGVGITWRDADAVPGAAGDPDAVSVVTTEQDGAAVVVAVAPVRVHGRLVGAVQVTESLAGRDAFVQRGVTTAALSIAGVTLLTGLAAAVAGGVLVGRRVDRLVEKTRQVARGDLEQPTVVAGDDEIALLAVALDQMSRDLGRLRREAEAEARARHDAELALLHADRLRTVGVLAAGVAHELGTPLNIIGGRARLILRRVTQPARVEADAAVISQQVDRITRIVQAMLDFSRASEPRLERADMGDVVSRAVALLEPLARQRGVGVRVTVHGGPVSATVDPDRIVQVVTNLVLNAVDASPPGGRVEVEVEGRPDAGAVLRVGDTGPGIPEDARARVLEPFFTTKPPGEGTGLGLSIVSRIAQDHGGRLEIGATPAGGALITLRLPPERPT